MKIFTALFSVLLFAFNVTAAEQTASLNAPLIKVEMNVDTDGVAQSIDQVNNSMKNLIVTLEQIAQNRNLTPQQTELINKTVSNINQLTVTSTDVVGALPKAINDSAKHTDYQ